jgi:hypothetical protein
MKRSIYTFASLLFASTLAMAQKPADARLQVIHNCADPAAAAVDIYINDGSFAKLENFRFRKATGFLTVPSGVDIKISVSDSNSTSSAGSLRDFVVKFEAGKTYVAVASGLVGAGFAANPDKIATGFDLAISAAASKGKGKGDLPLKGNPVSIAVMHGATDAPTVDIEALGVGTLVDNAAFRAITAHFDVPAQEYVINVKDKDSKANVASYKADLSSLGNSAAVVFASGFLSPANNKNGKAFGLFAALPDGTVLELGASDKALLQVIHNAPQAAAGNVDLYVNGAIYQAGVGFRKATEFRLVPAGVVLNVAVVPAGANIAQAVGTFPVTLTAGKSYVAVASGLIGGTAAQNPDAINTAFTILAKEDAKYIGTTGNVSLHIGHGSPDAPTVDVVARGVKTLVEDAPFKAITDEIVVPAGDYTIDIKDKTGTTTVASFTAPLSGLSGKSAVVLASGFFAPKSPETNGFALIAVLADGTVITLPAAPTSVDKMLSFAGINMYPVPANEVLNVNVNSDNSTNANYQISDMSGRTLMTGSTSLSNGMTPININVAGLGNGNYMFRIASDRNVSNMKFSIVK